MHRKQNLNLSPELANKVQKLIESMEKKNKNLKLKTTLKKNMATQK